MAVGLGEGVRKTAVREVGLRMRIEGGGGWGGVGVRVRREGSMAARDLAFGCAVDVVVWCVAKLRCLDRWQEDGQREGVRDLRRRRGF